MKSKSILILCFCIPGIFMSPLLTAQVLGDVDEDGGVDIVDALLTAQYYVNLDPPNFNPNLADVDCDNGIDIIDALLMAQLYVGLVDPFDCGGDTTVPTSPPASTPGPTSIGSGPYNYGEALQKAVFFYKAQRSGDLPPDYPLIWRADSCVDDGADVGLDLSGGWYDAGDHVKFNLPMAFTAAQLGWAVYEYRNAFASAGQLDIILDEIKWTTDYLIKCHPSPNVYYFQCGLGISDHGFWGPPEVIHLTTDRSSSVVDTSTPGSDAAGEAAAALAIASLIFEETDPGYASECLSHAEDLYSFADNYRGAYPVEGFYPSGSYNDDIAWAALWLYIKTNDADYLANAESLAASMIGGKHTLCWDDVSYGVVMKLAQLTGNADYINGVEINLDFWMPGGGVTYTPGGLAWLDMWGSLRYASGASFLAFLWADADVGTASKKDTYHQFAIDQMNYILGDNPRGGSYVVGFGENYPVHPHHKAAHGSWLSQLGVPEYHRHLLYGALVGGPGTDDEHNDDVTDYTMNEVADDYNAAFTGCMAKMYEMYGGDPIPDFPRPGDFRPESERIDGFFTRSWITGDYGQQVNILVQMNNRSGWPPRITDSLSCRYFIDISEIVNAGYSAGDLSVEIQEHEGATASGPHQWSGNIYYVEIDFSGTLFYPGGWEECEKDCRFNILYPQGTWDSSNDPSAQGLTDMPDYDATSFFGKTEYVPVYEDGVLIFGIEP